MHSASSPDFLNKVCELEDMSKRLVFISYLSGSSPTDGGLREDLSVVIAIDVCECR